MSADYILTIETTCDETAAAVIHRDRTVIAEAVASQEAVHEAYQGVVPELAARAHLERIIPIIDTVMKRAGIEPCHDLAAVAVASEPGLPGSLLVGMAAAKGLAVAWQVPIVALNHVQAHIYACQLDRMESIYPCLGYVVSGGHTNLYRCETANRWKYLGGTIDDAVGEAFDKVAVMLGLPYPGGGPLSRLAAHGDDAKYPFPRPMVHDKSTLNLSFSGLKTAVRYQLAGVGKVDFSQVAMSEQLKADIAASFQRAAIECVVAKAALALDQQRLPRLCVGGGVAANLLLRQELQKLCERRSVELLLAPTNLCTDNAVMGAIAWEKVLKGEFDSLDIDIQPGLLRG